MFTELDSAFHRLKRLPFPEFAKSDQLADWQADLAELDSYVAGIATTILGGGTPDSTTNLEDLIELRERLQRIADIPRDDHEILTECKNYLAALEEVVQSMNA